MSTGDLVTESREVGNFDRVALSDYGHLVITQGEEESLTIEAERDVLAKIQTEVREGRLDISIGASWRDKLGHALSTSLTRKGIKYSLSVQKLAGLEILGAARVNVSNLKTDRLGLTSGGAGDVNIESLIAEQLEVDLRDAGTIELTGQVAEQNVSIGGAGLYRAPKLASKRARVTLRGAGRATVWVLEDLDVDIHGLGSVQYYGLATVRKNISGLGSVTHLGNP
jgi:hypothetical protein